jgi:hypothetical protein
MNKFMNIDDCRLPIADLLAVSFSISIGNLKSEIGNGGL